MKIQIIVLAILLIGLASLPVLRGQLYYGASYGCGYVIVTGSSGGSGIIELIPKSGSPTIISVKGTSVLNSVALNGCIAIAVGSSSGGNPAYVVFNITSGGYHVVTLGGIGELYGVAYGGGYFVAVGFDNNTGLAIRILANSYIIIPTPPSYRALYGVAFGDGGFIIVGEGSTGAAMGFYNPSTGLFTDLSSRLPPTYLTLYSAAYGPLGFMVVGVGEVNSSGYIIQVPVAGLVNVTGGFIDLSRYFSQYSLLMSVAYIDYEYVFAGSTISGQGGYGYYSIYGITPLYSTVGNGSAYLPFILYSIAPVSPGLFYIVGNNGESSVGEYASIPAIYNVTFTSGISSMLITLRGPISLIIRPNATIPLPQGLYNITAFARGYYNASELVEVDSNEVLNITLSKVRYCGFTIRVYVNGTSEPVAGALVRLTSSWPNEDTYSAPTNASGIAHLNVICNEYVLEVGAPSFINRTYSININSTLAINISLTPIVNITLRAPSVAGEYRVMLRGVVNGSVTMGNNGSYSLIINKIGPISIIAFRLFNNITQYLGETSVYLKPGLNILNVTWETPIISSMGIRQVLPGNVSVVIYVNLSKLGNLSLTITYNGSVILSENATNVTGIQLTRNFTENGIYLACAYTWSLFNGSRYIDYGPVCVPINVVLHSELIVFDESGLLSRLSGYYLGNYTINVTLPTVLTFNNGTRLIYNGSIFNGEYLPNSSFVIKLSRVVNWLKVLWIREYLVRVEFYIGNSFINTTEMWVADGGVVKYPSVIYLGNETRLINETNVEAVVHGPLTLILRYGKQYLVTIREYSATGLFNETQIWANAYMPVKVGLIKHVYLSNNTRLRAPTSTLIIEVDRPLTINVSYITQYLIKVVKCTDLGVFNVTYLWADSNSSVSLINNVVQLNNSTRFMPEAPILRFNATSPMTIMDRYIVQYLLLNSTIVDNSTWFVESSWVNASATLRIAPSEVIYLGNGTRLVLSRICINGACLGLNATVKVDRPLDISCIYYRQWYVELSVYTLNGTLLVSSGIWVNSSSPALTHVKWGNLTIGLASPLTINASMVSKPIEAVAEVAYRVFSVKDRLGLPAPFSRATIKCSSYTVTQVSNSYGLIKVLIPVGQVCLIEGPMVGYYSLTLIIALLAAILMLVIKYFKK